MLLFTGFMSWRGQYGSSAGHAIDQQDHTEGDGLNFKSVLDLSVVHYHRIFARDIRMQNLSLINYENADGVKKKIS